MNEDFLHPKAGMQAIQTFLPPPPAPPLTTHPSPTPNPPMPPAFIGAARKNERHYQALYTTTAHQERRPPAPDSARSAPTQRAPSARSAPGASAPNSAAPPRSPRRGLAARARGIELRALRPLRRFGLCSENTWLFPTSSRHVDKSEKTRVIL